MALPHALPELTEREREILGLIAQGQSNAAIARQLALSTKTVSNYVSNIFSKLQVADRAQAILRAKASRPGGNATTDRCAGRTGRLSLISLDEVTPAPASAIAHDEHQFHEKTAHCSHIVLLLECSRRWHNGLGWR